MDMDAIVAKIEVPVFVTRQDIEDILVTAFDGAYGGSWYWIKDRKRIDLDTNNPSDSTWSCILSGGYVWLWAEDGRADPYKLDLDAILEGIKMWAVRRLSVPLDGERLDIGSIDAIEADVIVQLGALGEVVYG
jgi:hypothetical protein